MIPSLTLRSWLTSGLLFLAPAAVFAQVLAPSLLDDFNRPDSPTVGAGWVETYGAPAMRPNHFTAWLDDRLGAQQHDPITDPLVVDILQRLAVANLNCYTGCWDVVGWNGSDLLFAEFKRRKQDRVRSTQHRWLNAGLQMGLQADNFLLVEWDFASH